MRRKSVAPKSPRFGTLALTSVAAVIVLLAPACGGSTDNASGVASLNGKASGGGPTTTGKPVDTRQLWLDTAKCMRDAGIDFPDPTFDADGRPQFNNGGERGAGRIFRSDDPKTQAARKTCSTYFDQIRGQFAPRTPEEQAARKKATLDLAACMRDQGVDFPDPTFDANGRPQFNRDGGGAERRSDPNFQKAIDACRTKLGSELQGGPGGGGGFGGGRGPGGGGDPASTPPPTNA